MSILKNHLPVELTNLKQWVHWKYVTKNDRATKVPIMLDGAPASSTDSKTWTEFPENQPHNGVGIVFANDLAGIDLDGAIVDKKILPWASEIIKHFDSYTEVSPSGTGVHILFFTKHDFPGKKKWINQETHEAVECYKTGRYFTVTGRPFPNYDKVKNIETEKIEKWMSEMYPQQTISVLSPLTTTSLPDDDTILNKIRLSRNGGKFQMLYDQGDFQSLGFASQSEADLSLAGVLMFFSCNDIITADRLFRRSRLYREKWDTKHGKETFGQMTLMKAQRGEVMNWLDPKADDPQDMLATNRVVGDLTVEKTSIGYIIETNIPDGRAVFTFTELSVSRKGVDVVLKIQLKKADKDTSSPFSTRIDIRSSSAQSALCTNLNNAFGAKKDGYNWSLIVNNVFTALAERMNTESGSVSVAGMTYTEPEFLLKPFLQKDATNMIFAQGETGKTFWTLYLGVALIAGKEFFGYPAKKGHKILFVDYEDTLQVFSSRLHRVCQGLGVSYDEVAKHFYYLEPQGSVKDIIEVLRKDIAEKNISLAIFDAGGDACGGSPNDEKLVIELFNALQTLKCTKLVIHHEPKTTVGLSNEQAAYGSAYWRNRCRVAWRLEKKTEDEKGKIVKMSIAKKSNLGYLSPIHYNFQFESYEDALFEDRNTPGVFFTVTDAPVENAETKNEVVAHLKMVGQQSMKEIQDALDIPRSSMRYVIESLENKGKIRKIGGGKGRGKLATYEAC